jgi:hypothetical protein
MKSGRTGAAKLLLPAALILLAGCSGDKSTVPEISPRGGANQALADFDANTDGSLDAKELDKCPGLKAGVSRIDKDGDGLVTADELAARLTFLKEQGSQGSVGADVTLDGKPLADATVTLVPEKFMGPTYKPAKGVTDSVGTAMLTIEGAADDAVPLGYYRVEVSKKDAKGQEVVPATYNTQTTLSYELAPDARGRSGEVSLVLRLKRAKKK